MSSPSVRKSIRGKPVTAPSVPQFCKETLRSKAAPVRRHAVIAMQLRFLRTIAPVEILVGAERRRALQLLILDVEFVGLESGAVAEPAPGQRNQIGSDAEKAAEAQHGVGYLAGDLVDHQPLDVADHVAVRPPHGGA